MDTPQGHEQNADQIAYWNGPGGQRWADRQAAQDILLQPIADLLIDRAKPKPGERVIDVGCGSGATSIAVRRRGRSNWPCVRHRRIRPDAGAGAADGAEGSAGRLRAGGCDRLSVRSGELRSAGLALRRDVLCRSGAVVHQPAQGVAAIGAAGVRLLARAEGKSVLHGAAAGGLQARAETAAAGAGRSRTVCVRLRGARQSRPRRGRFHGHRDGAVQSRARRRARPWAGGGGAERVRNRTRPAARSKAIRRRSRAAATNSVREVLATSPRATRCRCRRRSGS